tara:strand:- start:653 stop:1099 length:447 start_codon:yes stop_codon:yes gene_type:complete
MADLLSSTDKTSFQNSVLDLFDTFGRTITVHKEPQKKVTAVNPTDAILPGYKNTSNVENIEYVPVSASFTAMVRYQDKQGVEVEADAGIGIPVGKVSIKVKEDCRNYINNGRTEHVEIDGKSFKVASNESVKDHFGLKLYVYFLEEAG